MTKDPRDYDSIKMSDDDLADANLTRGPGRELDVIGGRRPNLDSDDVDLGDDDSDLAQDLGHDMLDEEFDEPLGRPARRKSGMGSLVLWLLILGGLGGGGYYVMNDPALLAQLRGALGLRENPTPILAQGDETPTAQPGPVAQAPTDANATPEMPPVEAAPPAVDETFTDLPLPAPIPNTQTAAVTTPSDSLPPPEEDKLPPSKSAKEPDIGVGSTDDADETAAPRIPDVPTTPPAPDVTAELTAPDGPAPAMPALPEEGRDDLTAPRTPTTPVDKLADKTPAPGKQADKLGDKPQDKSLDKTADKSVDKSAPDPADKPVDKSTDKPVGKTADKLPDAPKQAAKTPADNPDEGLEDTENSEKYLESMTPAQDAVKATKKPLYIPPMDNKGYDMGLSVTKAEPMPNPEQDVYAANKALELGRNDTALEMFEALYKKNPRDERILMGRAVALQKTGRTAEAIRAYEDLLALNPEQPQVLTNMLGLVRRDDPAAALRRLLELRQRYPDNATIAAQTGLANASVGNLEEGLRYLNIAATLEPDNPKHFFNMAVIAERMGSPDRAVAYYEKSLEADAINPGANRLNRDTVYDRLSVLRQK